MTESAGAAESMPELKETEGFTDLIVTGLRGMKPYINILTARAGRRQPYSQAQLLLAD